MPHSTQVHRVGEWTWESGCQPEPDSFCRSEAQSPAPISRRDCHRGGWEQASCRVLLVTRSPYGTARAHGFSRRSRAAKEWLHPSSLTRKARGPGVAPQGHPAPLIETPTILRVLPARTNHCRPPQAAASRPDALHGNLRSPLSYKVPPSSFQEWPLFLAYTGPEVTISSCTH
jgi:hypothetical protein